jgi:hypothetical protein
VDWAQRRLDANIVTGRTKHNGRVPARPRGRLPENLAKKDLMARTLWTKNDQETYAQR